MNAFEVHPAWAEIEHRIDQFSIKLAAVDQAPQNRPRWTQQKPQTLQHRHMLETMLQRQINKIIAGVLTEHASAIRSLPPTQHQALMRSLSDYSKRKSMQLAKNLLTDDQAKKSANHKDANNKRIVNVVKLIILWLWILDKNLDAEHKKELKKELHQLLATQEKRTQQAIENTREEEPKPKKESKPVPILPIPKPNSSPKETDMPDFVIAKYLDCLGLGINATKDDIEQAFKSIQESFIADYANEPGKSYLDDPDYQLALEAYQKLSSINDLRLKKLGQISDAEIKDLVKNLNPLSPIPFDLLSREVTIAELGTLLLESELAEQKEDSSAIFTSIKAQKMNCTLKKLANHFKAEPNRPILLKQFLAEEGNQNRQNYLSPKPSPQPRDPRRV